MPKKIILFSLQSFRATGGIQKMTRTLSYSLFQLSKEQSWVFKFFSVYDSRYDLMKQYLPPENYSGFGNKKIRFVLHAIRSAKRTKIAILSHINLSLIGIIMKLINPNCRVWLIAHGIEVWRPLSPIKRIFLKKHCDKVICVSNFTKDQMIQRHQSQPDKCIVLNNAVDPFIKLPDTFEKPEYLLNRYQLSKDNQIVFTLTRLASSEQYKGYDQVIKAVSQLKSAFPHIKYILSGQYDEKEEIRIKGLIAQYDLQNEIILTGFLSENELTDHFLLADLFVLPSKKEGFGIVFIEAMACGLPVICGNADGSIDAIVNGELGTAIDVDDLLELENMMTKLLQTPLTMAEKQNLQKQCLLHFDEINYRNQLNKLINDESAC